MRDRSAQGRSDALDEHLIRNLMWGGARAQARTQPSSAVGQIAPGDANGIANIRSNTDKPLPEQCPPTATG